MRTDAARRHNRARLLGALLAAGHATRRELASAAALSAPTVSRVVDELLGEGLVREVEGAATSHRGRHATVLEFDGGDAVAAGVDMGATTTRFVVGGLSGRPLRLERRPTPQRSSAKTLAGWVADNASNLALRAGARAPVSIAVGVPGVVDPQTREIRNAPNLPRIAGETFAQALTSSRRATAIDNDANLALLGELYFGAARGCRSAVMFTIGTGLGAAVVIEGRLYRGRTGFAGEFGSVVSGSDSRTLEDSVAGEALIRAARKQGLRIESAGDVFNPRAGAPLRRLRQAAEKSLLVAVSAASAAYDPELIVLGGRVSASLGPSLDRVRTKLATAMPSAPPIVISELGDLAGALGGLVAALEAAYARIGVALDDLPGPPALATEDIVALVERAD